MYISGLAWLNRVGMCTLIFLYRIVDGFPIVAMHNRYAPSGSHEAHPTVVRGSFKVYCPLDTSSKGTWIGFNERGLFAAVTNQDTGGECKVYRSRGLLITDILTSFSKARDALSYIKRELLKGHYKRGNFILADSEEAYHLLHDERVEVENIDPGIQVFTNLTVRGWVRVDAVPQELLKYVEMRRRRAFELASKLKPTSVDSIILELKSIASDHGGEAGRGSICYHNGVESYMSSSTIVAVSEDPRGSKILYCRGNPCEHEFVDYTHILRDVGVAELSAKSVKLAGKRIALCVTGSVACIESPKLARELRRHGADVTCYMTQAALDYGVSPHLMQWATGRPVTHRLTGVSEHLEDYDLVVVYPATLNTVNKIAQGLADDAVSTLCASTHPTKLLIAPAMNLKLYSNPILTENIGKLRGLGVTVVEPRISEGAAKVAAVQRVVDQAIRCLTTSRLRGRGVLILSGPTRYDLDPIRYISNKSTGRLGYWLAKEAFQRGCNVRVIYGPGDVTYPSHIQLTSVYTVDDMLSETLNELEKGIYEIAIFSAAVLDFKPATYWEEKVRSGSTWHIELKPTPKIIEEVSTRYPNLTIVGFKLEYKAQREELTRRAEEELRRVRASLIVANDLSEISGEHHNALLVSRRGLVKDFHGTKEELAREIFDLLEEEI